MEEQIIAELVLKGLEPYTSGLKKATGATDKVGDAQQEAGKKTKTSATSFVRAAASAAIVYKGYSLLKGSIDTTVQLAKDTAAFSRVTGLDAKQAQSWVLVAKERGLTVKTLQTSMATLGRQLGALGGTPSKSSIEALDKLGLSQSALLKMPMEKKMGAIADAFNKLPNGVNKAALAQKLLGRTGVALLPVFQGGSKGMKEQLDIAKQLVPTNAKQGKAALELVENQRKLSMATEGVKVALGTALIPVMDTAIKFIQPLAEWFGKLLKIFPPLGPIIVGVAGALAALLIFDKIASAVVSFTGAWETLAAVMGVSELLLFGIVLAVAALVVGLVIAYKKIGWFHDLVNAAFNGIKDVVLFVFDFIKDHWKLLAVIIGGMLLGPIAALVLAFLLLSGKVKVVFNAIKTGFTAVKNWVLGAVNDIVGFFKALPGRISAAASGAFDAVKNAITGAKNWVVARVSDIVSFVKSIPSKIKAGLASLAGVVASVFKSAFSVIPDIIKAPINWIIKKIDAIHIKIPGFVPVLGGHQLGFSIPLLAGGGTVMQGGLALVGERGPEVVTLPGGAVVTPLPPPPTTVEHGRRPIVVQTFLEKRMIGQAVADYAGDLQASR